MEIKSDYFDERTFNVLVSQVLSMGEGGGYLPLDPCDLLDQIKFEEKKTGIKTSYDALFTETSMGGSGEDYKHGPVIEGEGVLLGEMVLGPLLTQTLTFVEEVGHYGFKLWLLEGDRLSLHFFTYKSRTTGRLSGLGYTGYEEEHATYRTPFRKTVKIGENRELILEGGSK